MLQVAAMERSNLLYQHLINVKNNRKKSFHQLVSCRSTISIFSCSFQALTADPHSILCHTVLSFHTCHPRHNYFAITPPPLPKVCRAGPASHSEVSPSVSLPLILSLSKLLLGTFLFPSQKPARCWLEQLRTVGMWGVAAHSSGESVTFHRLP